MWPLEKGSTTQSIMLRFQAFKSLPLLQTSRGSKRSAELADCELLQEDRGTSDDAKRPKSMDARMLSHEEKLERR